MRHAENRLKKWQKNKISASALIFLEIKENIKDQSFLSLTSFIVKAYAKAAVDVDVFCGVK